MGNEGRRKLSGEQAIRAYDMRIREGRTWKQIGEELGVSPYAAKTGFEHARRILIPEQEVETARLTALEKIDLWEQMALDIYHQHHVLVNFGRVVQGVEDFGPKIQVIDRLIKLENLRKSIVGYTAPTKRVVEVITQDAIDKAIEELNEQAAKLEREASRRELEDSPELGPSAGWGSPH